MERSQSYRELIDGLAKEHNDKIDRIKKLEAENERVKAQYNELLMAVETKCEGESRHQTALRYIKGFEERSGVSCVKKEG